MSDIIFSYRGPTDPHAQWLCMHDLATSTNPTRLREVYQQLTRTVTTYESNHIAALRTVGTSLYKRIIVLQINRIRKRKNQKQEWRIIILLFLTFGILIFILLIQDKKLKNDFSKLAKMQNNFLRACSQIEDSIKEKTMHPQLDAIKELIQLRYADPNQELGRLNELPRINRSFKQVHHLRLRLAHQIAFGHSLELREKLQDTHYIINHGQNLNLMVVNIVTRILKQKFTPDIYQSCELLRHTPALGDIPAQHTLQWFQDQIHDGSCLNDHNFSTELLCGDIVLESSAPSESALSFFSHATNVANRCFDFAGHLLQLILQHYIFDPAIVRRCRRDIVHIISKYPEGGNLYSICVPKDRFHESCYVSKSYGVPVKEHIPPEQLDQMQSGTYLGRCPQIRVLMHTIRPEDGYHVILHSTLPNQLLVHIEKEVSLYLEAAFIGYRLPMNRSILHQQSERLSIQATSILPLEKGPRYCKNNG